MEQETELGGEGAFLGRPILAIPLFEDPLLELLPQTTSPDLGNKVKHQQNAVRVIVGQITVPAGKDQLLVKVRIGEGKLRRSGSGSVGFVVDLGDDFVGGGDAAVVGGDVAGVAVEGVDLFAAGGVEHEAVEVGVGGEGGQVEHGGADVADEIVGVLNLLRFEIG